MFSAPLNTTSASAFAFSTHFGVGPAVTLTVTPAVGPEGFGGLLHRGRRTARAIDVNGDLSADSACKRGQEQGNGHEPSIDWTQRQILL